MNMRTLALTVLLLAAASVASAESQDALQKVKDLYAAAAYEDALAVVASLPEENRAPELDQYRAFCLIALGQKQQARAAIETLLNSNPLYEPDPAETSPRVLETFSQVRLSVLPSVAKKLYADAKTALERKNRKEALEGFETLLKLIESAESEDSTISDMKVLAEGFRDLSMALPEEKSAPKAAAPADASATNTVAAPAAATPASWTRPVALKQDMPRWNAPDPISRRSEFSGILRVRVGADGKVVSSEMVKRVHPMYDALLMNAAQAWLYEPAKQDGVAVPAEVLVEVRLRPQE